MAREKEMETRKIVSMPLWLAKAINDYRFDARLTTEAKAIRSLIIAGLRAEGRPVEEPARRS